MRKLLILPLFLLINLIVFAQEENTAYQFTVVKQNPTSCQSSNVSELTRNAGFVTVGWHCENAANVEKISARKINLVFMSLRCKKFRIP